MPAAKSFGSRQKCATVWLKFFEHELKASAAELGGRAKSWPTRYGFSLLLYFWDLLDDSIDLLFWCDWIAEAANVLAFSTSKET